ncbi:MAG: FAD-dependent oxidoreductase [Anaerolineales bacterium]
MNEEMDTIVVYGTTWCLDCKRAKQFFGDQRIAYRWVDIEEDPEALARMEEINGGKRIVPTILFPDGDHLVEPSNAELAEKLGITREAEHTYYDVIIVGAGPAGLTAGMYTAREGLDTLIIEKGAPGGQAGVTQVIDNFPGFDKGISGEEFAERLTNQAERFGVEILQAQTVTEIRLNGQYREVLTADGSCYAGKAVLLSTGARYRRLDVPGESELIGTNIHFCATCDGAFYKGDEVFVIGGGNSGLEEGLFLTKFAERVTIVEREDRLGASQILQEKVKQREDMDILLNHTVEEFKEADGKLEGVILKNRVTGETKAYHPDGVFVFIGLEPNSDFLPEGIERKQQGFVVTDSTLQSTMRGVFAAGDVREGATAQAASAAGEGATAALMIRQFLESIGEK